MIGGGWPSPRIRHQRLAEAAEIIRDLFGGDYVQYSGQHFEVEHRLFDLPDVPVPMGIAASGPESIQIAASYGDAMIATEPDGSLASGSSRPPGKAGPDTGSSPCVTARTRPPAGPVPCGPDTGQHLAAARKCIEAGFTHLVLAQVGADQQAGFMGWAESELLPELRKLG